MEDALVGIVLDERDDGQVLERDLGKGVGEGANLGIAAEVLLDVPPQVGQVELDRELARAGGEVLALGPPGKSRTTWWW